MTQASITNETIRLFDTDCYLQEFNAVVLECINTENGYELIFDCTAFFPEEGGQSSDTGYIIYNNEQITVDSVRIKNGVIYHHTDKPLSISASITGHINWNERYSNMQQHSGEHIVSGYINRRFGFDNVGFHLGSRVVTLDFNGTFTDTEIADIELEANRIIVTNTPCTISFPTPDELMQLSYRSKKELSGQVRIVAFGEYDTCACCAPHVRSTAEIGSLKIISAEHFRGGTRISILCGFRALQYYGFLQDSIHSLSILLSSKPELVTATVSKLHKELSESRYSLIALQDKLLGAMIKSLDSDTLSPALFIDSCDAIAMRNRVNELTASFHGICSVFAGSDTDGYKFIAGSSDTDTRKLIDVLKELSSTAKGGGSAAMIQGSVTADEASIRSMIERINK